MKKVILSVFALCALSANDDFSKAQELVAKKDYEGACELFTVSCFENGNFEGCQKAVSACKMDSEGPLDHLGFDIDFMNTACDKGNIKACHEVANMSLVGNYAIGYDVEGAKKALSKACGFGNANSCANLADIYAGNDEYLNDLSENEPRLEDYKTQIDKNKAMEYYKKACELGLESACVRFENMRSQDLQDDYLKKSLALLEKNKASQLEKSQNAYKEWLRLDKEFLGSLKSLKNSIGDAVLNDDFIYSHILEQNTKRTALLCRESKAKDCAGEKSKGANRPNRDKIARDERGYSSKFNKAIETSSGNTAKILEANEAEVAIQDKWLNESYKKLRAKLGEEQKEQLKKAQRAWLKYRELDGDFIYDAQGGSVAKMDASAEFLDKLAARVVFFEKLLEKLGI